MAVSEAVRAQFAGPFTELEYPSFPGEQIGPGEVTAAIATARGQLDAAEKLLEHLGIF